MIGGKRATVDHRGRRVRLAEPEQLEEHGVDTRAIGIPSNGMDSAGGPLSARMHWTSAAQLLILVFALYMPARMFTSWSGLAPWTAWFFAGAAFIPIARLIGSWWDHVGPRFTQQIIVAGHCASCGFALAGLVTEDDGCVVCPECGAAWRSQREPNADA